VRVDETGDDRTAADVVRVMADGKVVATRDDRPDIGAALDAAIVRCLAEP